jgi:hypothetical protein
MQMAAAAAIYFSFIDFFEKTIKKLSQIKL